MTEKPSLNQNKNSKKLGLEFENDIPDLNKDKLQTSNSKVYMQAHRLKAKIDQNGHLVITEPINLVPGDVEIIILQSAELDIVEAPAQQRKSVSKVKAFEGLFENTQPAPPDFDPEQARWEALQEKHNL